MIVQQFWYLSPEAVELRRRDGTPPWGVHPCEVDATEADALASRGDAFSVAWREAARLRREIEALADG